MISDLMSYFRCSFQCAIFIIFFYMMFDMTEIYFKCSKLTKYTKYTNYPIELIWTVVIVMTRFQVLEKCLHCSIPIISIYWEQQLDSSIGFIFLPISFKFVWLLYFFLSMLFFEILKNSR